MSTLALAWPPVIVRRTSTPAPSPRYELSREDAELLSALRARNENAFAELLRRFGPATLLRGREVELVPTAVPS